MKTEIGEYIVGAYLKLIKNCTVVDYNVRFPGGGLQGLSELDVIGINFATNTVYMCEVTTHIRGLLYKDNKFTVDKIKQKFKAQKKYADTFFSEFKNREYLMWSPVVPKGYLTNEFDKMSDIDFVINERYTKCIEELRSLAKDTTNDAGNPFFRALQILEHLR